jgi:hypothetical protein
MKKKYTYMKLKKSTVNQKSKKKLKSNKRITSPFITIPFIVLVLAMPNILFNFVASSPIPSFDRYYETCEMTPVSNETLWTPVLLLTSPYGGTSTGSNSISSWGSFSFEFTNDFSLTSSTSKELTYSISASNGAVVGLFELTNWTIYKLTTVWEIGIGNNNPCKASYTAGITSAWFDGNAMQTYILLPSGSQVDNNIPTSFNMVFAINHVSYPSVIFSSLDFNSSAIKGYFSDCYGGVGTNITVGASNWIEGSITIPNYGISGGLTITQGSSTSTVYTYTIPNGVYGTWVYSTLSGQANPGLAFSYSAC